MREVAAKKKLINKDVSSHASISAFLNGPFKEIPDIWAESGRLILEMDEKPRFEDFLRIQSGRGSFYFEEG